MQLALKHKNQTLAIKLAAIALLMFGFGYALAPFYGAFCQFLGIDRAEASLTQAGAALRIEFDVNVPEGLPVTMQALDSVQTGKAGGVVKARFMLRNDSDQALTVRAVPSFAPVRAAGLLRKLECFCFDALTLAPKESREVTVVLLVADQLPPEMGAATLSYSLQKVM
ncbi:cytochrome c oxidase assembly protein [Chitinibacter bivalviorum]|uniref:Cytochrome c oxidase assembly protein CtaG n=1 Tax=Chitinibacter bivalviorum TaxID=2739434 RepID=A0A7H9BKR7_9NEIS|nr:cytochrome c oxidase assembly protein [Chitinibacter bivalviorum]QLG89267.1 cytochrome c oxidase assembly protein [Chitinibacter bivalviorum]